MKNKLILIISLIFISSYSCTSQVVKLDKNSKPTKIEKGAYYKTPVKLLKKFDGDWLFTSKHETLRIHIETQKKYLKGSNTIDVLVGNYCYSNTSDCKIDDDVNYLHSPATFLKKLDKGVVEFQFHDKGFNKLGNMKFVLISSNKAKIKLLERERITINGIGKKPKGFSIPDEIILTKQ